MTPLELQHKDICSAICEELPNNHYDVLIGSQYDRIDQTRIILAAPAGTTNAQYKRNQKVSTLLSAWPLFPGSLLTTEVVVSAAHMPCPTTTSLDKHEALNVSTSDCGTAFDIPVKAHLLFTLQTPLPLYLGEDLYGSGNHLAIIFSDKRNLAQSNSDLAHKLLSRLNTDAVMKPQQGKSTLAFYVHSDQGISGFLYSETVNNVTHNVYSINDFRDRVTILGKADLVLCDSIGIAIDAILASIPAGFICKVPQGYEKLQECIFKFQQHGNLQTLLDEQRMVISDVRARERLKYRIMQKRSTLSTCIQEAIVSHDMPNVVHAAKCQSESGNQNCTNDTSLQATDEPILNSPHCESGHFRVEPFKTRIRIASTRRKLRKFQESPKRFLEDSQHKILRRLIGSS